MAARLRLGIALLVVTLGVSAGVGCRQPPEAPRKAVSGNTGGTLVASLRSEPRGYNRYVDPTAAGDVVAVLTQARLVEIDRTTDELRPALAERWTQSPDGLSYTLKLRNGVQFSDGAPFTSADVLFSARAAYDPKVGSAIGSGLEVAGRPLVFEASDASTVVVRLPTPFAPGLRLLDNLPILPRHKLEAALNAGSFSEHWKTGTPPAELAGLGAFVLTEHVSGERLVFTRNPRYWRRDAGDIQLPYLEKLTVAIVADQNAEALRLESGATDLMSNGDIRPDDYAAFKRASDAGKLRLIDVGVSLDPNLLWFNLRNRNPLFREKAFRQAVSFAIDRQAIVNTVYLGAAVPIYGPVTPGNKTWYSPAVPTYPHDPARAKELLASLGLKTRQSDSLLVDRGGRPVRFSLLTHKGNTPRERTAAMIQEHLRQIGIGVDIVALDQGALVARWSADDYDSIYFGVQASSTDPAIGTADFWLSSGPFHFWNANQRKPATDWEALIDDLMRKQASAPTLSERQQLFAEAQKVFGEAVPAIYLVAPRVLLAISRRVDNPTPALQSPQLLWSAETLRASAR